MSTETCSSVEHVNDIYWYYYFRKSRDLLAFDLIHSIGCFVHETNISWTSIHSTFDGDFNLANLSSSTKLDVHTVYTNTYP